MAFDTLKFTQRLQQVGLASKSDVASAVKGLQADMKLLEQRITIKLGAIVGGAVAIIVAAQKLF
jgi:hypothetical protein